MSNVRTLLLICALAAIAILAPQHTTAQFEQTRVEGFNPRDLSGVWWVDTPGPEAIFARAKNKDTSKCESCHPSEHASAEPALTSWAKEHATFASAASRRAQCDPIGVPAQFWYTQLYPFEFVITPDRIFQFFEKQSEWRVIWMKRGHPSELVPSYMGDSIGKWEGDTLLIDTVGFNGKSLIEPVGINHVMSDAFHLVERWRRTSAGTMELDVTYYDPKVWGDKSWTGIRREFLLQPRMDLMETYCTAEDNARFEEFVKPLSLPRQK